MEFLAGGGPAGGATADLGAREFFSGSWTETAFSPAVIEEPGVGYGDIEIGRNVVTASSDGVEGEAGYVAALAPEFFDLGWPECTGGLRRVNCGAPQDFIGHPVADAGEAFLHEQDGFNRGASAAL